MALSKEMRLLAQKWKTGQGWPKRLEAVEINNVRGWSGQKIDFDFPIVAIVGENGAGKSTILQAAASVYKGKTSKTTKFASSYFPDTPWERITGASIRWWVKEGRTSREGSIRKETTRWRGNPERRERHVENIDLSRIQPVFARTGYSRLAKPAHREVSSASFDSDRLARLASIMGKSYSVASMSLTNFDATRSVPVIEHQGSKYSGFHGGAGETTMVEFLKSDFEKFSLVVIDEIETSLHPRSQRRLMRDLAEICRVNEVQVILSTHSPYILEELPDIARLYVWDGASGREIVRGVSPFFAMTKMDLEQHPEVDVYVEDRAASIMVKEVVISAEPDLVHRCLVVPYGAASVGQSLGQMAHRKKFPRPTCVFTDGDQPDMQGCTKLPGDDAPEIVVFEALKARNWPEISRRLDRRHSDVVDACNRAMTIDDHHDWISSAADDLHVGGDLLWQAMCSIWVKSDLSDVDRQQLISAIKVTLV